MFGPFTVGASYSFAQYKNDGNSTFTEQEKFNVANGYVNFQLTPATLLGLGYTYTHASGDTSANYHQVSIGADYSLSKRTDVYAQVVYQHAMGDSAHASIYNGDATTPTSSSPNQTAAAIGLRHRF